ncbi:MAG: winged helix-turn-helix domain-containing protein [Pseudomonadota bacterium]
MLDNGKRILISDTDNRTLDRLESAFERHGFSVIKAKNKPQLQRLMDNHAADLVVLNVDFDQMDSNHAFRFVGRNHTVPFVTVSDVEDRKTRLAALEAGADDHLIKPLDEREVVARSRAILRRIEQVQRQVSADQNALRDQPTFIRFHRWIVDPAKFEVHSTSGEELALTTSDFNMLLLFLNNAKRVLSRDAIAEALRGTKWSPFDRSIDNQIARLRKKIEDDPTDPKIIKTVRGEGYTFTADIETHLDS